MIALCKNELNDDKVGRYQRAQTEQFRAPGPAQSPLSCLSEGTEIEPDLTGARTPLAASLETGHGTVRSTSPVHKNEHFKNI